LEAETALGRPEAVVERYERLCRDLEEQFGLEPSRNVKLLYRRLLSQDAGEHPAFEQGQAQEIGT
jgi:DNA-binding SARP family transcriptional activator